MIGHFQKEWQTGARMSMRSIMGSFGGAHNCAKSKTDVFQILHETKTDENTETKR